MGDRVAGGGFGRRRGRLGALILLAGVAAGGPALAQTYELQAGDTIRLTVVGLPDAGVSAMVGDDGRANLLQYGTVKVAGRSIETVQNELRAIAGGMVLKRYGADGAPSFIGLGPEDIFVDVAAFQPVYVTGDVASSSAIEFRPGLTLRAALAAAGGVRAGSAVSGSDAAANAPRLQADYASFALRHAALLARQWRLDATEAGERDPAPPRPANLFIAPEVFAGMVELQRRQLEGNLDRLESQRAFLEASLEQARQRLKILEEQNGQQKVAVQDDEEEQRRMQGLLDRGLVQTTRFLDSRRALLLSSTRLLDTQNNLARVALEITDFERRLKALDEDRARDIQTEREEVRSAFLEVGTRLAAARESLEINGLAVSAVGVAAGPADRVHLLHRRVDGVVVSREVDPDIQLRPGDVVEVIEAQPDPFAAP